MSYGADITRDDNPFHVGLDRLVNLDKAIDFIGKDSLVKAKIEGVDRKLVGVEIDIDPDRDIATERWPIVGNSGLQVGEVRSRAVSSRLNKYIGYAMLPIELTMQNTQVRLVADWASATAIVVPLPFKSSRARVATD